MSRINPLRVEKGDEPEGLSLDPYDLLIKIFIPGIFVIAVIAIGFFVLGDEDILGQITKSLAGGLFNLK